MLRVTETIDTQHMETQHKDTQYKDINALSTKLKLSNHFQVLKHYNLNKGGKAKLYCNKFLIGCIYTSVFSFKRL
jgi:hypothetical protein